jgi:predicted phage tail protein
MLLAVELTSLARRRIPRRLWRQVHLGSFVLFGTSTVHALTAGTDTAAGLGMIGVVVLSVGVIAMVARRIAGPSPQSAPERPPARVDVAHPVEQLA